MNLKLFALVLSLATTSVFATTPSAQAQSVTVGPTGIGGGCDNNVTFGPITSPNAGGSNTMVVRISPEQVKKFRVLGAKTRALTHLDALRKGTHNYDIHIGELYEQLEIADITFPELVKWDEEQKKAKRPYPFKK